VRNPWDRTRVPGGSSGGSAAPSPRRGAVRDRHRHRRLGAPAGGVLRHHRLEADYGRVSRYGMIAYASSLDQAGVLRAQRRRLAQSRVLAATIRAMRPARRVR
jgi:aspartyl-tRNA(Asn)/glutamyl-tRNA(Gln) amidotransferase subunit A